MNKVEYAEQVCKCLNQSGYETIIHDHYRNNASQVAITVKVPDVKISPVFIVGDNETSTPEEFAEHILHFEPDDISVDAIQEIMFNKENVLSRVHYILVNAELNKSREGIFRKRINKSLELHYKVDISDILEGSQVTLEQRMMDAIGLKPEEVYGRAYENTMEKYPYSLSRIGEFLPFEIPEDAELPIYVLSNESKVYGAGAILYKGMKEVLEEAVAEETIIIPSSVHEVLVLPAYLGDRDSMAALIQEVNSTVVSPEEILSDRPYQLYSDGVLFEL